MFNYIKNTICSGCTLNCCDTCIKEQVENSEKIKLKTNINGNKIIFAPHLDDEVIGCSTILDTVDYIIYFTMDYRRDAISNVSKYIYYLDFDFMSIKENDILYLPSRFDYHPLHKVVRNIGLHFTLCKKYFYSVEMNVPWLDELNKEEKERRKNLMSANYPKELMSGKYEHFYSIKPYDHITYAEMKGEFEGFHKWGNAPEEVAFLRNLHRHKFNYIVKIQQFHNDRNLEFFICKRQIDKYIKDFADTKWTENTSCEMISEFLLDKLQLKYPMRSIEISVYEDNENGSIIKI